MARRQRAVVREVPPDHRYQSAEVSKFINVLMLDGKKSVSEAIFYEAMRKIEERTGQPALNVFRQAVSNARPVPRPIRCRLRFDTGAGMRWHAGGSCSSPAPGRGRPWPTDWPASCWKPAAARAEPFGRKRTSTGWRRPTRRSLTTGGSRALGRRGVRSADQPSAGARALWVRSLLASLRGLRTVARGSLRETPRRWGGAA